MALKISSKAPNFNLPDTSGDNFILKDNVPCILYFYPKDFTPNCTKEACSFRDGFEELRGLDIDVFGISRDSLKTHLKFKEKHRLPFELISDKDGKVCKQYDALIPVINVPKRITYLIDKDMTIRAAYSDMFGAEKHLRQMISELN